MRSSYKSKLVSRYNSLVVNKEKEIYKFKQNALSQKESVVTFFWFFCFKGNSRSQILKKKKKLVKKSVLFKQDTIKKKSNKKKNKFKNLTKKQKKKIRMTKANRIIYPASNVFMRKGGVSRKQTIFPHNVGKEIFVHDGYSWVKVKPTKYALFLKFGCLAFKTRPISPVRLNSKGGVTPVKMAQATTYKIKAPKVKRKK